MTRILKLKQGTPGQESAKSKLDALRANGLISAENDALIQKIALNANTWAGERMKDASKREREAYLNSLYESMYNIASGGLGYDPYSIGNDIVRLIVSDTMAGKEYTVNKSGVRNYITAPKRMTFANPSNTSTGNSNIYWYLAPEASITGDWAGLSTNDLKSTILNEGNKWLNNLLQVLNAKNQGLVVLNFKGNLSSLSQASLDSLAQYLNNLNTKETADYEDIGNFARIMSVLTPGESEHFNAVFQPYLDAEPVANKNWRDLKAKGYTETTDTHEYLTQNKYKVLQDKSGKKYIYDENYNLIENPINYIDRNTNYGIFSNGTNTFIGNIDDENLLNEYNPLYKTIQEYKTGLKADEALNYEWNEWYDPELNELYKTLYNEGILKNGTRFTDVSNLFDGTEQVIAINNDGSPIKSDLYGEPDLSKATLYYWDGFLLQKTTKKEINQNYNRVGYGEEKENKKFRPLDISEDFKEFGEKYMNRDIINANKDILGETGWLRFWNGGLYGGIANLFSVFNNDTISDDLLRFADEFISAIQTVNEGGSKEHFNDDVSWRWDPSSEKLLKNFGYMDSNSDNLLAIIGYLLNNKNINLSKEQKALLYKEWNKAYKRKNEGSPQSQKQGGILKGKQGLTVGAEERAANKYKKDDNIGKALEADFREYSRNLNADIKGWSTEDTLRLGSLAADLGGAIAAFVPGAGTIASVGTGLASTVADLGADIIDDSTSMWELGANLVTNLGFTAAGAIPGVKLGKVAKSMIKWAPRIIAGVSAANIALNDDIHDSLAKLNENSSEMTVQDWKNVLTAATALLGAVKVGKSEWDNRTVKKALGKGTFSNKDLTTIDLSEDQVKLLNKALKSGNTEEAKKLAKKFKLKEKEFDKFLEETKHSKRTLDAPIKKKEVYQEIEFDKNLDYLALRALYKQQGKGYNNIKKWIEINDPNYNSRAGDWLKYLNKLSRKAKKQVTKQDVKKFEGPQYYGKGNNPIYDKLGGTLNYINFLNYGRYNS